MIVTTKKEWSEKEREREEEWEKERVNVRLDFTFGSNTYQSRKIVSHRSVLLSRHLEHSLRKDTLVGTSVGYR